MAFLLIYPVMSFTSLYFLYFLQISENKITEVRKDELEKRLEKVKWSHHMLYLQNTENF